MVLSLRLGTESQGGSSAIVGLVQAVLHIESTSRRWSNVCTAYCISYVAGSDTASCGRREAYPWELKGCDHLVKGLSS